MSLTCNDWTYWPSRRPVVFQHMTHKFIPLTTVLAAALILTACGTEESKPYGSYDSATDIRDALNGTNYECETWTPRGDTAGSCDMGIHGKQDIHTGEYPAHRAAFAAFDSRFTSRPLAAIIGDDWYFTCSPDLGRAGCTDVHDAVGGDFMFPDGSVSDQLF